MVWECLGGLAGLVRHTLGLFTSFTRRYGLLTAEL